MKEKKTLKERWIKTKEDLKGFWDEHGSWICMTLAAATLTGFTGYLMGEGHEKDSIIGGLTNAQMDTDEPYAMFMVEPSEEAIWSHPMFLIATKSDLDAFEKENDSKKIEAGS